MCDVVDDDENDACHAKFIVINGPRYIADRKIYYYSTYYTLYTLYIFILYSSGIAQVPHTHVYNIHIQQVIFNEIV